jgi:beta-alanine--pyruvate transaminase
MATLDLYEQEGLFERARTLAPEWEAAVHALRDAPYVIDVRNLGLVAGIELEPRAGLPGARAYDAFVNCFHEQNALIRVTGDIIALSPPLTISVEQIHELVGKVRRALLTITS